MREYRLAVLTAAFALALAVIGGLVDPAGVAFFAVVVHLAARLLPATAASPVPAHP